MSGKKFGWGGVALAAGLVWVLAQAETENEGTINRSTQSGGQVLSGVVRDAGVVIDEVRSQAGGLASDLGGAVEGQQEPMLTIPGVPQQVQPQDEQG